MYIYIYIYIYIYLYTLQVYPYYIIRISSTLISTFHDYLRMFFLSIHQKVYIWCCIIGWTGDIHNIMSVIFFICCALLSIVISKSICILISVDCSIKPRYCIISLRFFACSLKIEFLSFDSTPHSERKCLIIPILFLHIKQFSLQKHLSYSPFCTCLSGVRVVHVVKLCHQVFCAVL